MTEDPVGTTTRWAIDDQATTRVARVVTPTRIISLAIEARVAPVGNSKPREPPHTATIRVAAGATPTHIREETTTSPAQITVGEVTTSIVKVETGNPTVEATPLTAAPAEVVTLIAEVISLDLMTDAGMIDLGMIETTSPHLEMIRVINLRQWTPAEITALEMVPPDSISLSLLKALYNPKLREPPQPPNLKQMHRQIKLQIQS
jgi:hypothetical protein